MKLQRYLSLIFWLLIAAIVIAVSLANRKSVIVSFDPVINPPTISLEAPLYIILLALFIIGILVGSVITWISQRRHRKALRRTKQFLKQAEKDIENKDREMRKNLAKAAQNAHITMEQNTKLLDVDTDKN